MSFTAPRRTQRRHRLAQAGTLGAALTLLLTACGGDPEPGETTTAPPSTPTSSGSSPASSPSEAAGETSPAPSPSTGAPTSADAGSASSGAYVPASADGPAQNVPKPEMPEVMKEETKEGAEAAVEYFWEAHYYAEQTGDTEVFDTLYSEYCEFCTITSDSLQKDYDKDRWYSGTEISIDSLSTLPSENGFISTIILSAGSGSVFDSASGELEVSEVEASADQPWISELWFDPNVGRWIVDEMSYEGQASGE